MYGGVCVYSLNQYRNTQITVVKIHVHVVCSNDCTQSWYSRHYTVVTTLSIGLYWIHSNHPLSISLHPRHYTLTSLSLSLSLSIGVRSWKQWHHWGERKGIYRRFLWQESKVQSYPLIGQRPDVVLDLTNFERWSILNSLYMFTFISVSLLDCYYTVS